MLGMWWVGGGDHEPPGEMLENAVMQPEHEPPTRATIAWSLCNNVSCLQPLSISLRLASPIAPRPVTTRFHSCGCCSFRMMSSLTIFRRRGDARHRKLNNLISPASMPYISLPRACMSGPFGQLSSVLPRDIHFR